jgi:hypothetical protein
MIKKYTPDEFYNDASKYLVYVVTVDNDFYPADSDVYAVTAVTGLVDLFGKLEIADNIARTIGWYKYCNQTQLAFRLAYCDELIHYLDNLSNISLK